MSLRSNARLALRKGRSNQHRVENVPSHRRFPPPWTHRGETYFFVKDSDGQQLVYVHFDNPRSAAKPLSRYEARRIAANIAKLPELLRKP